MSPAYLPLGPLGNNRPRKWDAIGALPLSRVQAAAPDFTAWWTSADPTSMLLAANGVGGFVSASGQTVGGWLNVKDCGSKTFAQCLAAQPELITNPGDPFTATTGYTNFGGSHAIVGDDLVITRGAGTTYDYITVPCVVGRSYYLDIVVTSHDASNWTLRVGSAPGNFEEFLASPFGSQSFRFTAGRTTEFINFLVNGTTGQTLKINSISIKELPTLPLLQASGASEPQYLLSGGIGSLNTDGVNDYLSTGTLASALPSDCAVYLAIKANPADTQYMLMSSSASPYFYGTVVDSDGGSVTGGAGTPSFELDAAGNVWAGTRDTLHNDLADDAGHIFVGRNVNLSNFPDLYFGVWGYNNGTYLFTGAYRDILIVPESVLTANPTLHADIMAMLAARYPS